MLITRAIRRHVKLRLAADPSLSKQPQNSQSLPHSEILFHDVFKIISKLPTSINWLCSAAIYAASPAHLYSEWKFPKCELELSDKRLLVPLLNR